MNPGKLLKKYESYKYVKELCNNFVGTEAYLYLNFFKLKNKIMKSKFFIPMVLVAGLMLVSFSASQVYGQTTQDQPVKQQTVMYTCPMHLEVVQNHPGNCPVCGMKLVEKKDVQKGNMHQAHDSTCMKHDPMKMKHDSTSMKQDHMKMKHDSTSMKQDHMKM